MKIIKNSAGENDTEMKTFEWDKLPFLQLLYKSENELIAGGYDYNPVIFKEKNGTWYSF